MSSQDTLKQFFHKSERAKQVGETMVGVYCVREECASKTMKRKKRKRKEQTGIVILG